MSKLDDKLHEIGQKTPELSHDLSDKIYESYKSKKSFQLPYFIRFIPAIIPVLVVVVVSIIFSSGVSSNKSSDTVGKSNYQSGLLCFDQSDIDLSTGEASFIVNSSEEVYILNSDLITGISSDDAVVFFETSSSGSQYVIDNLSNEPIQLEIEFDMDKLNDYYDGEKYSIYIDIYGSDLMSINNGSK